MATEQTERSFQKQPTIFVGKKRVLGKKVSARDLRFFKNVGTFTTVRGEVHVQVQVSNSWIQGLGFKTPKEAISATYIDKKCPFTGNVSIRGRILRGVVVSTKMKRTIVIRRDYLHYIPKYNRFEKRHTNLSAHCSPAFKVKEGDIVTVGQCRPLSKTVRFNVLRVQGQKQAGGKQFRLF